LKDLTDAESISIDDLGNLISNVVVQHDALLLGHIPLEIEHLEHRSTKIKRFAVSTMIATSVSEKEFVIGLSFSSWKR